MALRAALACALLLAVAGCGTSKSNSAPSASGSAPVWPAPPNAIELTKKAGLIPERAEFLQYHVHAHLDVFFNGAKVRVPAGIGINIHDPAVHSERLADGTFAYGGIDPPCKQPCISPLHTHVDDGILHTESKTPTPNRLGQFFTEWDVRLTSNCVGDYCDPKTSIAIYVDGETYDGDPRKIELSNFKEIAIVIGSPPDSIPSEFPQ